MVKQSKVKTKFVHGHTSQNQSIPNSEIKTNDLLVKIAAQFALNKLEQVYNYNSVKIRLNADERSFLYRSNCSIVPLLPRVRIDPSVACGTITLRFQ